jgi:hypothetical protein
MLVQRLDNPVQGLEAKWGLRYNQVKLEDYPMNSLFGRREDEVNYRKEGRLPPGQAMTKKFPVLHYGPVPRFDPCRVDI